MNDNGRSRLEELVKKNPTSDFAKLLLEQFHHFVALGPNFHYGCGSYLIDGQSYTYEPREFKKQEALFRVGQKSTSVLEIGVYLGHSLLILLLSNPTLQITCIDIDPTFTPKAVEYLNVHFGNRIRFFLGNSHDVLKSESLGKFDCIHIDADHRIEAVQQEFILCHQFASPGAYFVFDDYEAIRLVVDGLTSRGVLESVETPWCSWTNTITRLKSESS